MNSSGRFRRFLSFCASGFRKVASLFEGRGRDILGNSRVPLRESATKVRNEAGMNGLKTARVLIIDDDPEEVAPVLAALGQMGVGAVCCTGQADQLPTEPLYGVRLLFLDMDLGGLGGDAKQMIGQVMTVLKRVLPANANPLLIVVWTKHKELFDDFRQTAAKDLPHLRPGVVSMMGKAEFGADIKAIAASIVKLLGDNAPLDLIYLWEQCVHDAASYTVGSLSELVGADPQNWHKQMNALLGALLQASAGSVAGPPSLLLACFFESLALVHLDQLSQRQQLLSSHLEPHAKPLTDAARGFALSAEQKATLNRMLLTETPAAEDRTLRPGNVYFVGDKSHFPGNVLQLEQSRVAEDVCEKQGKADELVKVSKLLVMEITPACDFAQGKQRLGRFVAGLLVPSSHEKLVKRAQFAWISEAIALGDPGSSFRIVLDAHFLLGFALDSISRPPDFRFRAQAVISIQAWFAGQAARPGYVSVC